MLRDKLKLHSNPMIRHQNPDLAKHRAIYDTVGLILVAFCAALVIAFGLRPLISSSLSDSTDDAAKSIVTIITSLLISLFFMWLSFERIKTTVGLAIDVAVEQKLIKYKQQNPAIEQRLRTQLQEYSCAIPPSHRSELSIQTGSPNMIICNKRIGRDAVIRSLSYNDELLQGIAYTAVAQTLSRTNRNQLVHLTEETEQIFFQDIYVYLKAWLMMSITHGYPMQLGYIRQRYPSTHYPDRVAYIAALRIVKERTIKSSRVTAQMNETLKDQYALNQALTLLDEYLATLITQLSSHASPE